MFSLNNRLAVIIVAASGIGAATAVLFASRGADLVLGTCPGDPYDISAVKEVARSFGRRVITLEIDTRSKHDVDSLVAAAIDEFGRVDVPLANAAIA